MSSARNRVACSECGDVIPVPVARDDGRFVCARCFEPVCYGLGCAENDIEAEQSMIDTAAEQIENDPRIAIILIMRRARPPRTWREIARKIGVSHQTALNLYRRSTAD